MPDKLCPICKPDPPASHTGPGVPVTTNTTLHRKDCPTFGGLFTDRRIPLEPAPPTPEPAPPWQHFAGIGIVCPDCGALVSPTHQQVHTDWHARILDAANRYKSPPVYK